MSFLTLECSRELAVKLGASDMPGHVLTSEQIYKLLEHKAFILVQPRGQSCLFWKVDRDAWRQT